MNALESLTASERDALERARETASIVATMAHLLTGNPVEPGLAKDPRAQHYQVLLSRQ